MKAALEKFLAYLQVEKGCSPNTVAAYRFDLDKSLLPYLREQGKFYFTEITGYDIRAYLDFLAIFRGNSSAARARKLSSVKAFFNYLVADGQLYSNPAASIRSPRVTGKEPAGLDEAECRRLLETIARQARWQVRERDTAIIMLLLHTGIKVSEMVNLIISDADTGNARLTVTHTGSKRHLHLDADTAGALERYLAIRPATGHNRLFAQPGGSILNRAAVYRIVRRYLQMAKISKAKQGPHMLRQTYFARLHQEGVDPFVIKVLAGHKNIATTMRYSRSEAAVPKETVLETALRWF